MRTEREDWLLGALIVMLAYKICGTPIHALDDVLIDLIALAELILEAARRK